jgi:hypothetical protein
MLGAFVNELEALVSSGKLTDAAAGPIAGYAHRMIASLGG